MANDVHVAELADAIQSVNGKLFKWRPGRGIIPASHTTVPTADVNARGAVQTDITLSGIMRVNAAGSITPQVTFSAGPTGTCETDADSFLMLIKLGSGSFAAIGPWV